MNVVEGVATEIGTDIETSPHAAQTLFRTNDPVEVVEQAGRVADALKGVLTNQRLTKKIGDREHVLVEGWTTLGSMLGVFAIKEWVREVPWPETVDEKLRPARERGLAFGYEASYRAQRADGTMVGGAEAECKRTEGAWKARDDYALKSMAQTRATSKALRVPLGFIVTLAGYEATPEAELVSEPIAEPVMGHERASRLLERIGREIAAGMPPDVLAEAFIEAGAHPERINAAAVEALTEAQATVVEDYIQTAVTGS